MNRKNRDEIRKIKDYVKKLLSNQDFNSTIFDLELVTHILTKCSIEITNRKQAPKIKEEYRLKIIQIFNEELSAAKSEYYYSKQDNEDLPAKTEPNIAFEEIIDHNNQNKELKYTIVEQKIANKILLILREVYKNDLSIYGDIKNYCIDRYNYKDISEYGILVKHCNSNSGCFVSYILSVKDQEDIVAGQNPDWAIRYGNTINLRESDKPGELDAANGAIAFNISDKSEFMLIQSLLGNLGEFLSDRQNQGVGMNSSNDARCWISLKDIILDDDSSDSMATEEDYIRKIDRLKDAIVYCYKKQINALKDNSIRPD